MDRLPYLRQWLLENRQESDLLRGCEIAAARPRGEAVFVQLFGQAELDLNGTPTAVQQFRTRVIAQAVLLAQVLRNIDARLFALLDRLGKVRAAAGNLGELG